MPQCNNKSTFPNGRQTEEFPPKGGRKGGCTSNIKQALAPYWDVILFVITLFAANGFWKLTIQAEECCLPVLWFGLDISAPFAFMCEHVASIVYHLIRFFNDEIFMMDETSMRFFTGNSIRIVWGCTAIKQSFIWLIIMLFARGPWKHKVWFIPLGWLVAYLFNILRIFLIALAMEHHPEWFELLHTYIFKYLFYGILFLLWVWWAEKFVPSNVSTADK